MTEARDKCPRCGSGVNSERWCITRGHGIGLVLGESFQEKHSPCKLCPDPWHSTVEPSALGGEDERTLSKGTVPGNAVGNSSGASGGVDSIVASSVASVGALSMSAENLAYKYYFEDNAQTSGEIVKSMARCAEAYAADLKAKLEAAESGLVNMGVALAETEDSEEKLETERDLAREALRLACQVLRQNYIIEEADKIEKNTLGS
jgi:hypothetical protein